jgi:hypothetical protein
MLTPGDDVFLTVMQDRRRELNAQKDEAETRHARARAEELQAQIDELDADYDSVLHAAVLIQRPAPRRTV